MWAHGPIHRTVNGIYWHRVYCGRAWSVKKEQTWLTQCHEVAEVAVVAANGRVGGPAAYEYGR